MPVAYGTRIGHFECLALLALEAWVRCTERATFS